MKSIFVNHMPLSKEQMLPIVENPKYSLILAGAGSGKTMTLVGKVKYLLENLGINEQEICCISFTNEATNHLKEVIFQNTGKEIPCFTFHKLALSILDTSNTFYQILPENTLKNIICEFFASFCMGIPSLQKIVFHKFSFLSFYNEKNYLKIIHSKDFKNYQKTLLTFLHLFYANGYKKEDFLSFFKTKNTSMKETIILLYAIYNLYQQEKESTQSIDFDDMLLLATKVLQQNPHLISYKYILVDEFQDSSLSRFQFLKALIAQNDASFCAVGDDYQSIYRFSGCNLDLFLNFQKYFPTGKIYTLEMTYRNSEKLIQIANDFICKNPYQIKKNLHSPKKNHTPIIIWKTNDEKKTLLNIISHAKQKEIMILGRNHFDFASYESYLPKLFPDKTFYFYTVHASKGLESEMVILLHLVNETYGFPSKIKEEKILSLVKQKNIFPYEEERRLFYVALTRTKEEVHLITSKTHPSIFIKEITKLISKYHL